MFKQIAHNPSPKSLGVTNGVTQLEFKGKDFKKLDDYQEIDRKLLSANVQDFLNYQNNIIDFNFEGLTGKLLKKSESYRLNGLFSFFIWL